MARRNITVEHEVYDKGSVLTFDTWTGTSVKGLPRQVSPRVKAMTGTVLADEWGQVNAGSNSSDPICQSAGRPVLGKSPRLFLTAN